MGPMIYRRILVVLLLPTALRALGSPHFGGAIITAGGVIFIGGTLDRRFRALDVDTGKSSSARRYRPVRKRGP